MRLLSQPPAANDPIAAGSLDTDYSQVAMKLLNLLKLDPIFGLVWFGLVPFPPHKLVFCFRQCFKLRRHSILHRGIPVNRVVPWTWEIIEAGGVAPGAPGQPGQPVPAPAQLLTQFTLKQLWKLVISVISYNYHLINFS